MAIQLVNARRTPREETTIEPRDERRLAELAKSGDEDAFAELIRGRADSVVAFLRRMLGDQEDARDVAQLTFLRVWENLPRYDPTWAFSTWLFRIAGNLAIDCRYCHTSVENASYAAIPATEIGHNLFQGNTNDGATGSFAFTSTDPDPDTLFVNSSLRNFYLVGGVPAIDSSLNRADDRTFLAGVVKAPLGIPPSAIVAPERDVFGQVRADDENTDPLGGGSLVFKDRGAVERIDLDAPFAALVDPADGDSLDQSPVSTVVYRVDDNLFSEFTLHI